MKKHPLPPLTHEQQAEQVRQFDSVFGSTLKLTFDEPTADERHYVDNQHAEMLGAKELNLDGKPIRVVAYRYSDDMVVFHAAMRDPAMNLRQTMTGEFVRSEFDDTTFWHFLLSLYRKDLALRS